MLCDVSQAGWFETGVVVGVAEGVAVPDGVSEAEGVLDAFGVPEGDGVGEPALLEKPCGVPAIAALSRTVSSSVGPAVGVDDGAVGA